MGEMMEKKRRIEDLCREVMEEILVRLPAKSVLRSTSVCIEWYKIISDPYFAKFHLRRPRTQSTTLISIFERNPNPTHLRNPTDFRSADVFYFENGKLVFLEPCPFRCSSPGHYYLGNGYFLNSCDGLVCAVGNCPNIYLWNPTIRQCYILPQHPQDIKREEVKYAFLENTRPPHGLYIDDINSCQYSTFYGFGYDSRSDDYKVVVVFFPWGIDSYSSSAAMRVHVFSLKSNAWRSIPIKEPHPPRIAHDKGVVLHGAAHWIASPTAHWVVPPTTDDGPYDCVGRPVILAFDFEKDRFKEMAFPCPTTPAGFARLQVVGGHLHAYDNLLITRQWVMKQYGVEASWTKIVFRHTPPPMSADVDVVEVDAVDSNPENRRFWVLHILNHRLLLLRYKDKIMAWDHEENKILDITYTEEWFDDCGLDMCTYIGTLISPFPPSARNIKF